MGRSNFTPKARWGNQRCWQIGPPANGSHPFNQLYHAQISSPGQGLYPVGAPELCIMHNCELSIASYGCPLPIRFRNCEIAAQLGLNSACQSWQSRPSGEAGNHHISLFTLFELPRYDTIRSKMSALAALIMQVERRKRTLNSQGDGVCPRVRRLLLLVKWSMG